jgi:hypothetical protein
VSHPCVSECFSNTCSNISYDSAGLRPKGSGVGAARIFFVTLGFIIRVTAPNPERGLYPRKPPSDGVSNLAYSASERERETPRVKRPSPKTNRLRLYDPTALTCGAIGSNPPISIPETSGDGSGCNKPYSARLPRLRKR